MPPQTHHASMPLVFASIKELCGRGLAIIKGEWQETCSSSHTLPEPAGLQSPWWAGRWGCGRGWIGRLVERGEDLQVEQEVEGSEEVDWRAEGYTPNDSSDAETSPVHITPIRT